MMPIFISMLLCKWPGRACCDVHKQGFQNPMLSCSLLISPAWDHWLGGRGEAHRANLLLFFVMCGHNITLGTFQFRLFSWTLGILPRKLVCFIGWFSRWRLWSKISYLEKVAKELAMFFCCRFSSVKWEQWMFHRLILVRMMMILTRPPLDSHKV